MWLLERCKANWGDVSYSTLIDEALAAEPGRSCINPDAPEFANPEDMEKAIKDYSRAHGEAVPETRGQIVRCIYESLAARYAEVLENLRSLTGKKIETLHIIGGGSRNDLLNQWTADAAGVKVVAGPSEATACGNIMIQAIASGVAKDVASLRAMLSSSSELKTFYPSEK